MQKIKIFLASSSELAAERKEFEIFINRRNKSWVDKGIFLDLVIWNDFLDAMSQDGLQKEYNKAIQECELFVMLYFTKVGPYTLEEFETAFQHFQENKKPFIFTYFKDATINTGDINLEDLISLAGFQKRLKELGHYQTKYKNTEDLLLQFGQQLDKLADNGFIKFNPEAATTPTISQHNVHGDNVGGNQTKIGKKINLGPNSTYNEGK